MTPPDERIDVICPRCGEKYNLLASTDWWRCRNDDCRHTFAVGGTPDDAPVVGGVPAAEGAPSADADDAADSLKVVPGVMPTDAQRGSSAGEQVSDASPATASSDDIARVVGVIPGQERDGDPEPVPPEPVPPEPVPPDPLTPRQRRQRTIRRASIAAGALTVLITVVAWWLWPAPHIETDWIRARQEFEDQNWVSARDAFETYQKNFPESEHAEKIPFFIDLCTVGHNVYSPTSVREHAMLKLKEIFINHRDNPAYAQYVHVLHDAANHLAESFDNYIAKSLENLVRKKTSTIVFLNDTEETTQQLGEVRKETERCRKDMQLMETSIDLLKTVERANSEQQIEVCAETREQQLTAHRMTVEKVRDRLQALELVATLLAGSINPKDVDEKYREREKLFLKSPELANDEKLGELFEESYRREADLVKYTQSPNTNQGPTLPLHEVSKNKDTSLLKSVYIVRGRDRQNDRTLGEEGTYFAVARGVLYAFGSDGRLRWVKRLGVDSHRLPVLLPASASSPELAIVVSTAENALLALSVNDGKERWRRQLDPEQNLNAPLTIVRVRDPSDPNAPINVFGFLPTTDGSIQVIELHRGYVRGTYKVGQPISHPGIHVAHPGIRDDGDTHMVYFAADANRVYAIDPLCVYENGDNDEKVRDACPSLLFTGHKHGALRGSPLVLGPYLVMSEIMNMSHMRLKVFLLNDVDKTRDIFPDARQASTDEYVVRGWSWFPPVVLPDHVGIITDEGNLGLCGLNLTNRNEAIYPYIEDDSGKPPALDVSGESRSMLVHLRDQFAWVMVGGELRRLFLDLYDQTIRPVWPKTGTPSPVRGFPLHEAQTNKLATTFFLATSSQEGDACDFSAVNADTGRKLWTRELGVFLLGDPLVLENGSVVLLDRDGNDLKLSQDVTQKVDDEAIFIQTDARPSGKSASSPFNNELISRIHAQNKAVYLLSQREDGRAIRIRRVDGAAGDGTSKWVQIDLPKRIVGHVAVVGDKKHERDLLVPCDDGRLYQYDLLTRRRKGQSFQFDRSRSASPQADVYLSPEGRIILLDEDRMRISELRIETKAGEHFFKKVYSRILPARVVGPPLFGNEATVYISCSGNKVYCLNIDDNNFIVEYAMTAPIAQGPFRCGDDICVIEGDRKVCCLGKAGKIKWRSQELAADIVGVPVQYNMFILVTDESGMVTSIDKQTGETVWKKSIGAGVYPAAAAVPYTKQKILVPLIDGSFILMVVPERSQSGNEGADA